MRINMLSPPLSTVICTIALICSSDIIHAVETIFWGQYISNYTSLQKTMPCIASYCFVALEFDIKSALHISFQCRGLSLVLFFFLEKIPLHCLLVHILLKFLSFCLFFKLVFVGPFWNFILEHVVEIWATVGEWKSPIVVRHNVGDDVVWWRVTNVWGISLIVYHSIKDDVDIRVAAVGGKSSMTCEGHKADTAQEGELSGFLAVQVLSLKLVHLWLRKGKHC